MPDHVHLFLEVDPTFAASVIIKRVKGRASHHLRKEFPLIAKIAHTLDP
ncbi:MULTISPECIES: transposase [Okeania]|nr:transposase [Okeania hirsuta]